MIGPDFDHFCRLVAERSGLVLGPEKAYLLKGRLEGIARAEGLADVAQLLARIKAAPLPGLFDKCVDALATHESSFFRDGTPFEVIGTDLLPALLSRRGAGRRLRIWCAACSSGQEPLSLAIAIHEMAGAGPVRDIEILATDFSEPILEKARAGLYSDFEVRRGLSPDRLRRWFRKEGDAWRADEKLSRLITFRAHNLLKGVAGLGTFDLILCRNVLIYFDAPRKRLVLDDLARALADDGSLFLGSAETILGLTTALQSAPGARGLYRKVVAELRQATG
ncbi:MAG: CheR family methyltransferase [Phenylobacterium sp.]